MNLNTILGIIGLSLLAFVAAFAIGRQNRPMPVTRPQPTANVAGVRPPQVPPPAADVVPNEEEPMATSEAAGPEAESPTAIETAVEEANEDPVGPTPAELAARRWAAENRKAVAARRAHADQLPDDFKKYYAQELPADAISSEQNVQASVAGEQADVITLSSRAFNRENKDFVLQQVRSELEALGFKRVYITNGRGFSTKVGL